MKIQLGLSGESELFAVYFDISQDVFLINAQTLEITDNEILFKNKSGEVVAFYDRDKVKGALKVGSYEPFNKSK